MRGVHEDRTQEIARVQGETAPSVFVQALTALPALPALPHATLSFRSGDAETGPTSFSGVSSDRFRSLLRRLCSHRNISPSRSDAATPFVSSYDNLIRDIASPTRQKAVVGNARRFARRRVSSVQSNCRDSGSAELRRSHAFLSPSRLALLPAQGVSDVALNASLTENPTDFEGLSEGRGSRAALSLLFLSCHRVRPRPGSASPDSTRTRRLSVSTARESGGVRHTNRSRNFSGSMSPPPTPPRRPEGSRLVRERRRAGGC